MLPEILGEQPQNIRRLAAMAMINCFILINFKSPINHVKLRLDGVFDFGKKVRN